MKFFGIGINWDLSPFISEIRCDRRQYGRNTWMVATVWCTITEKWTPRDVLSTSQRALITTNLCVNDPIK